MGKFTAGEQDVVRNELFLNHSGWRPRLPSLVERGFQTRLV